MDWGGTANLEKSLKLILNLAVENKIPQKDMPKNFLILTDMGFEEALNQPVYDHKTNTYSDPPALNFGKFKELYAEKGYILPTIILWNINGKNINVENANANNANANNANANTANNNANETGVITLAGFSISLLKSILQGPGNLDLTRMTPIDNILNTLNKERYDKVFEIIKEVDEKEELRGFEKWDFEDGRNYV